MTTFAYLGKLMIVTASNGHFFTQIPQPIHNSSEMDAILKSITFVKMNIFTENMCLIAHLVGLAIRNPPIFGIRIRFLIPDSGFLIGRLKIAS